MQLQRPCCGCPWLLFWSATGLHVSQAVMCISRLQNHELYQLAQIRGVMVSTTVRGGGELFVYGTFLHFIPTSPSPTFDWHCSSLFSSITEKLNHQSPPNLDIWFSNFIPFMKVLTIFAMHKHGGNIKKCNCIGHFFIFLHHAAMWELHSTKSTNDHGDNLITNPCSKQLTEHCCSINSHDATPFATIMARCLNPQIPQQPILFK